MLVLYTILLYLLQPVIWFRLWYLGYTNPTYRQRWTERYGFFIQKIQPNGIHLHAVSVGETLAAIPLITALHYDYPDIPIILTTMTPTGSDLAKTIVDHGIYHVYLPYDLPGSMRRFLKKTRPKLVIIMETELWPNMINLLHSQNIPLIIANARLSERSARSYQKISIFMKPLFQTITLIAAQNKEDSARFIKLGVKQSNIVITGNLKFDIHITSEMTKNSKKLRRQWASSRPIWIATSTHHGEEKIILETHKKLLESFPNLLLILAPRHPSRCQTICCLTQKYGFNFILRSSCSTPSIKINVVIIDTIGELMLLYGIADLAFVGGSLVKHGGHNPLEPALHAIPVLMGPHTFNFKNICERIKQDNGLITVTNSNSLTKSITMLLLHKDLRIYYGAQAKNVLQNNQGARNRLLHILESFLPPKKNYYENTTKTICSHNYKKFS
ncbi:lipid IV(A) 3-deoxy-D-manno-octulosonic acid transferase [Candidatus Erwinia haradaeae]|uniref:3-deoxy-D-manno-octulosonic acid transferase n=1 Tax=Candidatus Erwinia haradaeae TaxID=1922217 RepID=A0A803GCE9_9GAMM|nr:lipid IV(A) 3-deoxy-D-manno-octulosonic acid transferase [Candidatus Erwinia haradaeae]VFP87517.1 3-deoxy-D-manno-octulosonic acid transferase [Candidatus Erwinia haradaeae]